MQTNLLDLGFLLFFFSYKKEIKLTLGNGTGILQPSRPVGPQAPDSFLKETLHPSGSDPTTDRSPPIPVPGA